jgi:hypothetical protein
MTELPRNTCHDGAPDPHPTTVGHECWCGTGIEEVTSAALVTGPRELDGDPPRRSRVCSSTIETMLIGRPRVVESN